MTDLSRAVNAPGITGLAYDNADGILYLSIMSGEVLRFNPTTSQFLAPIQVGGDLSSIAVSPDGSFLLVGSPVLTSDGHGGYNATIDRITLSSSNIDPLTVPVANATNLFDGVLSLAITNNGQAFAVIYGQEWQFAAAATTPTFNLTPSVLYPALSTADQGRYLIETGTGTSPPPFEIVDTQTNTTAGPINLDNTPMAIDVSPTTGQVAAAPYYSQVSLYDHNLTLEQHLNSSATSGDSLVGLHYSADGQSLFVLDASKDSVVTFNTTTWAETGSISLPAGALQTTNPEQMTVSPDGRFLFVQTIGGVVSVDLSAHPTSVAAAATGTATPIDTPITVIVPPVGASANTTQVTSSYTVAADQNQVFNEAQSPPYELIHGSLGAAITFDDQGQVHVNSSVANADLAAVIDDGQVDAHALVKVSAGGVLEVDATGSGSSAIGYTSPQFSGSVENDGTWLVSGVATAAGVARLYSPYFGGSTFTNTGDFEVNGSAASGVSGSLGSFSNSGQFSVSGTQAFGVSGATHVTNSGTLSVTANDHHAVAIQGAITIDNSGIITADVAIAAPTDPGIAGSFTPALVIDNSGTINGAIDLGLEEELLYQPNGVLGADITNTGAINGAIHFDDGNVTYNGAGGTQTGGIYLGEGTDRVVLGNDGETVHDNSGYDNITGGAGNDTVFAGPGDANFDGGAGTDTLVYGSTFAAATLAQTAGGYTVSGPDGVDTLSNVEILQFADQTIVLRSGPMFAGTPGNDTLAGDATDNLILGQGGNDTLYGGAGNDSLYGGAGNDYMDGGPGNDVIDGGAGWNVLSYGSAPSAVNVNLSLSGVAQDTGGAGIDTISNIQSLYGSAYNDTLTGGASDTAIYGGAGNDTIRGGPGNDNLFGGAGND
jgi:hypothetical protein